MEDTKNRKGINNMGFWEWVGFENPRDSPKPVKSITVEPFHQDPESGSVPLKDFYRSTPTVAERKHAA